MGPSSNMNPLLREAKLDEADHLLRTEFVKLYLEIRSPYDACIKLGFMEAYAMDWAKQFMGEGVVRRLIAEADAAEDSDKASDDRKRKYRTWMEREATNRGADSSHGSRVTAISHLMKMEGMEAPREITATVEHKGGVMMVPQITNPNEWGKHAAASQSALKQTVKD